MAGCRSRRNRLDQIGVIVVDVAAPDDRGGPLPGSVGPLTAVHA